MRGFAAAVVLALLCGACVDFEELAKNYCASHPRASSCPADGGEPGSGTDGGQDAGSGDIAIYLRGDLSTANFSDGLSGQTPQKQMLGIGRIDFLPNPTGTPVTVVDYGAQPLLVDMASRSLAGRADRAAIPAGTYTHGRMLLTQARFSVFATAHQNGYKLPGLLTVVGALSESTFDGRTWPQGSAEYRFVGGAAAFTAPGALPVLPNGAGGNVSIDSGRSWLVFAFSKPFVVDPADAGAQSATVVFRTYRSFRWQDDPDAGFEPGVFDIDGNSMKFESVKCFGATDYFTETP